MSGEGGNGGDHPVDHHLSFQLLSDDGGGDCRVDHHLSFRVFSGDGGGDCRVDHHLSFRVLSDDGGWWLPGGSPFVTAKDEGGG